MRQIGGDEPLELGHQLVHLVRGKINAEQLDGDEAIFLGLVRTKNGTEGPGTDLMEYAKWSEGVRRRSTDSVRAQRVLLMMGRHGS